MTHGGTCRAKVYMHTKTIQSLPNLNTILRHLRRAPKPRTGTLSQQDLRRIVADMVG